MISLKEKLRREKIKLQNMIGNQLPEDINDSEIPLDFMNKSTEEIVDSLEQLQRHTRNVAVELQVEFMEEQQRKKEENDISEFKKLAQSLITDS